MTGKKDKIEITGWTIKEVIEHGYFLFFKTLIKIKEFETFKII